MTTLLKSMKVRFLAGLAVAVAAFYLFSRNISFSSLAEVFGEANKLMLGVGVAVNFSSFWLRSGRWRVLLEPVTRVGTAEVFGPLLIGFAGNNVFPARAGEFIRAGVGAKKLSCGVSSILGSILVERLLDVFTLIGLLGAVMAGMHLAGQEMVSTVTVGEYEFSLQGLMMTVGWGSLLVAAAMAGLILAFSRYEKGAVKMVDGGLWFMPTGWRSRVTQGVLNFMRGVAGLASPGLLLRALVWSGLVWFVVVVSYLLVLEAFGVSSGMRLAIFLVVATAFSSAIPTPGYIGPFHLAAMGGLILFGVGRGEAEALAIALHAISVVPVTIIGLMLAWKYGFSMPRSAAEPEIQS